jgi:[ribosomal protein S5]-alanine N-acetyltransferase
MAKIFETARLILRRPVRGDAPAIIHYLNNYKIAKNTARIPYPYRPADADGFLTGLEGSADHAFAITEKEAGAGLIGVISLEHDDEPGMGEIGYWLAEPFWGRGMMREAAREVVRFGFHEAGFKAVSATYHLDNEASKRILYGLGMKPVGFATGFSLAQNRDVAQEKVTLSIDSYVKENGRST